LGQSHQRFEVKEFTRYTSILVLVVQGPSIVSNQRECPVTTHIYIDEL
jgi:hypothetical protein